TIQRKHSAIGRPGSGDACERFVRGRRRTGGGRDDLDALGLVLEPEIRGPSPLVGAAARRDHSPLARSRRMFSLMRPVALATLANLMVGACAIDDVNLEGKACPCVAGFTCDLRVQVCRRNGTFVQSASLRDPVQAPTVSATFPSPTTAGNLIVA